MAVFTRHVPRALLLGLGLLLCGGCRTGRSATRTVPPPGGFALGLYDVPADALPEIGAAGFNLVTGPATADYLKAAARAGVGVLATPGTSAGFGFKPTVARDVVRRLDRHPALWGWYLVDEPDMNQVSPALLEEARGVFKHAGARKPLALVLQNGVHSADYSPAADVVMVDRYPVAWQPLETVEQHVLMTRLGTRAGVPVFAVLQAFDWAAFPKQLPGETAVREPTFNELRAMAYGALAQRAEGIFFYTYKTAGWDLAGHPALWNSVKQLAREISARNPLFQAARPVWNWRYNLQFVSGVSTRLNAAQDSKVTLAWLIVSEGNAEIPTGHYILAINNVSWAEELRFLCPVTANGQQSIVGEHRTVQASDGWIRDRFEPMAVHVYGPLR